MEPGRIIAAESRLARRKPLLAHRNTGPRRVFPQLSEASRISLLTSGEGLPVWMLPTVLILLGIGLGPLGAYAGILEPGTGFFTFLGAALLALVSAVALGGAAAFASAFSKAWRGQALRGAFAPLVVSIGVVVLVQGGDRNPFNDVTTDLTDPPVWTGGQVADSGYPEEFIPVHEASYPDLGPIEFAGSPADSYAQALATARAMPDWEVALEDPDAGTIQAVATSRVFRFVDDIVIRVRPSPGGSRIDLRSKSRVGRGDLGANAARVRAFQEAFETGVAAR